MREGANMSPIFQKPEDAPHHSEPRPELEAVSDEKKFAGGQDLEAAAAAEPKLPLTRIPIENSRSALIEEEVTYTARGRIARAVIFLIRVIGTAWTAISLVRKFLEGGWIPNISLPDSGRMIVSFVRKLLSLSQDNG
jgi:hypothetical protein